MKVKLSALKETEQSMSKLLEKDLNVKVAWKLGKLVKKITVEFQELEENRIKLIKKYGKENAENKQIEVTPENVQKFMTEYGDLLNEEIELDFTPITLSDLGDIQLTTMDVVRLSAIISEND